MQSVPETSLHLRTDEPLLWLAGAGHERRGPGTYHYDARQRNDPAHVNLQLTLRGRGMYRDHRGAEPIERILSSGMAFFDAIPGEFEYGCDPRSSEGYELVFVALSGAQAFAWHRRIAAAFGPVLDFSQAVEVATSMRAIARARETQSLPDRYLLSSALYDLLMRVLAALNRGRVATAPRPSRAMELIASHARDPGFSVADLARRLNISREHLSRQFRAATGISPMDYLIRRRLGFATQALRDSPDDKLHAVALRCGFSSPNYFCRVFRQHLGVTPAQFRARRWMMGI